MNYIDEMMARTNPEVWQLTLEARKKFRLTVDSLINDIDSTTTYDDALSILCMVSKPATLNTFKSIMQKFKEPPIWSGDLLLEAWVMAEVYNPLESDSTLPADVHIILYTALFEKYRPQLSSTLEQFKGRGDIKLFSGATIGRPSHSWTLDKDVAQTFVGRVSRHQKGNGELLELIIDSDELARLACFYTNAREEQEVYFLQDMRSYTPSLNKIISHTEETVNMTFNTDPTKRRTVRYTTKKGDTMHVNAYDSEKGAAYAEGDTLHINRYRAGCKAPEFEPRQFDAQEGFEILPYTEAPEGTGIDPS